jgi:hypothetical protein
MGATLVLSATALLVPLAWTTPVRWLLIQDHGFRWTRVGLAGISVESLAVGHRDPELAFAGTEAGLYRHDRRRGWQLVLPTGSVAAVTLLPDDRTVIVADSFGTADVSPDGGRHWYRRRVLHGGVYGVAVDPVQARLLLVGADGGIYRSLDAGRTWRRQVSLRHGFAGPLVWQPRSCCTVFAATGLPGGRGVLVSYDAGATWRPFASQLRDGGSVMSLAARGRTLYAGTMGNGVWRTSSDTGWWRKTSGGMPPRDLHIAAFAFDPGRPNLVFVAAIGHGVYRSMDGGKHWHNMTAGLPIAWGANVVLAVTDSPRDHQLYVGTDDGVYRLESP